MSREARKGDLYAVAVALHQSQACHHGFDPGSVLDDKDMEQAQWFLDCLPKTHAVVSARERAVAQSAIGQIAGWRFTGDDVTASLKLLGPPGTKGEGIVKIAAEAAAIIHDDWEASA